MGRVKVVEQRQRRISLEELCRLVERYFYDLKEYRKSMQESLSTDSELGRKLMTDQPVKGLLDEEVAMIRQLKEQLKIASHQQSLALVDEFLQSLRMKIKKIEEDSGSQEKALPLMTGTVGFLISVLIF